MREKELLERAFAMPLTSPAYPRGPYRFVNREYLIITYRTDAAKLRAVVPEPLEVDAREAVVKYEFIRMPDSNGFGDYTESGQVIPVSFRGRKGGYTHCMFLNDEGPIAGGRELWGFPKKLAQPILRTEIDTLVEHWIMGRFASRPVRWATSTAKPIRRKSKLPLRLQTFCSRSFRMLMARHASASWSNTISRTWRLGAHGQVLRPYTSHITPWRRSLSCRCSRSCPQFISSAILPSASVGLCTTICGNQVEKRWASTKWPWRLEAKVACDAACAIPADSSPIGGGRDGCARATEETA